ncbi:hypothetical protein [Hutsoniella sourekii]|uniref:hypothetical protein n=1 Tax=Hutsoniella sourekii TaxID=87650 RepID=UPI0004B39C59|nr:hypothetical protein [Hutsoniella sourekii]
MRLETAKHHIKHSTGILELVIAIIICLGIAVGIIDLLDYLIRIFQADTVATYDVIQSFLGYALLLIVGIELILMILYHSTNAILELILFVIARKMLIYASTMLDLVLGTTAIAIIFVVMRFLVTSRVNDFVSRSENQFTGGDLVADVIAETGIVLPVDHGETMKELLRYYALKEERQVLVNEQFQINHALITIVSMTSDGRIDQLLVDELGI